MAELASTAAAPSPGLGTCCAESQADGVPCPEICDCETCRRQPILPAVQPQCGCGQCRGGAGRADA